MPAPHDPNPMPFTLGMLTMPAMVLAAVLKDPSPVSRFVKAGAVSTDTARHPTSLKIRGRYMLDSAIRRGVLRDAGEGRFYVDLSAYRRYRVKFMVLAGSLAAVAGFALWWFVLHQPGG